MLEGKVTGFQDILGNDMVKEHFKKAIENHKISLEWEENPSPMHLP